MFNFVKKIYHYYKFYSGPYSSWKIASLKSEGYGSKKILSRVRKSTHITKRSREKFEIDSLIFSKPLRNNKLEKILKNILKKKSKINVIDFGGSLGSTFYRYKSIFKKKNKIKWSIIEQKSFVKIGRKEFENSQLNFFYNLNEFKKKNKNIKIDIFLLSSSIQYIKDFKTIIKKIIHINPDYIVILKTPFTFKIKNKIFIEKVPENIYGISYPSWIFSKNSFINLFVNYKVIYNKIVKPWIYSIYFHDIFLKKND